MLSVKPLFFATLLFGIAASAQATVASTCDISDVTVSTLCIGQLEGNDSELAINDIAPSGAFGYNDWDLLQSNNIGSSDPSEPDAPFLNIAIFESGSTWAINLGSLLDDIDNAIFAVKGGHTYALYLLDLEANCNAIGECNGTWLTDALINGGDQQPALSKASFYVRNGEEVSVSEPPVGLLLGAGLLALGTIRKYKKG